MLLASAFLVYGLFAAAFLTINVPPFQNPDEQNHFNRAYQISNGDWVGRQFTSASGIESGGWVDPAIEFAAGGFIQIPYHPDRRATQSDWAPMAKWSWARAWIAFPNTALYPPQFFIPAAIAIKIGRGAGMNVVQTLLLARAFTAGSAMLVAAVAVLFSDAVAPWVFAVLTLPMTLTLMSACSQDALLIAVSALIVALVVQALRGSAPLPAWILPALSGAFVLVATAKPPLLVLAPIMLVITRFGWKRRLAAVAVPVVCTALWSALVSKIAMVNVYKTLGANPAEQTGLMIHRPWIFLRALRETMTTYYPEFLHEFIGKLGWLDTDLPCWYYGWAKAFLLCGLLACLCQAGSESAKILQAKILKKIFIVVASLGCVAATFAAMYITWSTPGGTIISGVQGRYFIPSALIFGLALPALGRWSERFRLYLLVPVLIFPLVTLTALMRTIILRYYLQ